MRGWLCRVVWVGAGLLWRPGRAVDLRCGSSCLACGVLLTTAVLVGPWAYGALMKAEGAWLLSE